MSESKIRKSKSCCEIAELYVDLCDQKMNFLSDEILYIKEIVYKLTLKNIQLEFQIKKLSQSVNTYT